MASNKNQYMKSPDKKQQNIGRSRWFFNLWNTRFQAGSEGSEHILMKSTNCFQNLISC
jgi:hypothetical protein